MSRFDLDNFLPYQLAVLSQRVSERFSSHYRERFGINVAEWRVVAHLSQEDAVSVREICRRVNMDKPKVSRAASRLEEAGFLRKEENPSDRRLVKLSLTDAGRAMVGELTPIAEGYEAELAALLGEPDFGRFRALLDRLNTRLADGGAG